MVVIPLPAVDVLLHFSLWYPKARLAKKKPRGGL